MPRLRVTRNSATGAAAGGAAAPSAPTDPYIDNVSLLLQGEGTNGSTNIIDSSAVHALIANSGTATVSTTQSKFGSSSIYFDGSNQSFVLTNADSALQMGTGSFTVEFFLYASSLASSQTLISTEGWDGNFTRGNGYALFLETSGLLSLYSSSSFRGYSTQAISANTWTHVALVRSANTWTFYVNGSAAGSFSYVKDLTDNTVTIGRGGNFTYILPLTGYIDNLRITKGVARTIEVPTEAYPAPTNTSEYDFDAAKYFAAVESADGQTLEPAVKTAINSFVQGCKADGIWNAITSSALLAGPRTLGGALVRMNGAKPTNNNFVSGDYSRKTGLKGDKTTKSILTNALVGAMPQNNFHASAYITQAATADSAVFGVGGTGTGATNLSYYQGTYSSRCRTSSDTAGMNNSFDTGLQGVSRASSSSYSRRKSGVTTTASVTSQASSITSVLSVYRDATFTGAVSDARISFYSIGEALDLALLDTRLTALMSALATAIP